MTIKLVIVNEWSTPRLFVLEAADITLETMEGLSQTDENRLYFTLEANGDNKILGIRYAVSLRIYANNVDSQAESVGSQGQTLFELSYTHDGILNCDVSAVDGLSEVITYELRDGSGKRVPLSDDKPGELFQQNITPRQLQLLHDGPSQAVIDKHVKRLVWPADSNNSFTTLLSDKYIGDNIACAQCGLDLGGVTWDGHTFVNVQHNCRSYMHTLQHGEDSYCDYIHKLGMYCWAFDELTCTNEQCGYGEGYPYDSPCDLPYRNDQMRGDLKVALTCGKSDDDRIKEWHNNPGCSENEVKPDMQTNSPNVNGSTLTVTFRSIPWLLSDEFNKLPLFQSPGSAGICNYDGHPGMCSGAHPIRPRSPSGTHPGTHGGTPPKHFKDLTLAQQLAVVAIAVILVVAVAWRLRRPMRPRRRARRRTIRR